MSESEHRDRTVRSINMTVILIITICLADTVFTCATLCHVKQNYFKIMSAIVDICRK